MSIAFSVPKVFKVMLLILLVLILTIFIINTPPFDEEPLSDITKLLQPTPRVDELQNSFFGLMGLNAADDKEAVSTGIQLIQRYLDNRDRHQLDEITREDYLQILGGENLDKHWEEQYQRCNSRVESHCVETIRQQIEKRPLTDSRLLFMLSRYDKIVKMKHYQDIQHLTFATPLPAYGTMLRLGQLKMVNSYLTRPTDEFLRTLTLDLNFWRKMLSDSETLISQMVAIAAIRNDLHYLSNLIASKDLNEQQILLIQELLRPISQEETNIVASFAGEQRMMHLYLQDFDAQALANAYGISSRAIAWFIQPNATSNSYYKNYTKPLIELSSLSAKAFSQKLKQAQFNQTSFNFQSKAFLGFSPSSLYNFGGKVLLQATGNNMHEYIGRVHDLNGIYGLVNLQLAAKSQQPGSLTKFIAQSPFTNPFTGEAFQFDPQNQRLYFECFDSDSKCETFM